MSHSYEPGCPCKQCRSVDKKNGNNPWGKQPKKSKGGNRQRNWTPAYGGSDADGNPVTVSFGSGKADRNTLLADGDQSEGNFFDSANHDHFGPGNGPNNNGTRRGKYTGRGS